MQGEAARRPARLDRRILRRCDRRRDTRWDDHQLEPGRRADLRLRRRRGDRDALSIVCPGGPGDELIEILKGCRRQPRRSFRDHAPAQGRGVIDVSVTVSPIRERTAEIAGASTIARDITERRRAADALAEAEERFRGAFEEAPIGMAMIDLDGRMHPGQRDALPDHRLCGSRARRDRGERAAASGRRRRADATRSRRSPTAGQTLYASEKRFVHASGHPVWISLPGHGHPRSRSAAVHCGCSRRSRTSPIASDTRTGSRTSPITTI